MYETIEIFEEDQANLKEILKSCIYNYYRNYKIEQQPKKNCNTF